MTGEPWTDRLTRRRQCLVVTSISDSHFPGRRQIARSSVFGSLSLFSVWSFLSAFLPISQ